MKKECNAKDNGILKIKHIYVIDVYNRQYLI